MAGTTSRALRSEVQHEEDHEVMYTLGRKFGETINLKLDYMEI